MPLNLGDHKHGSLGSRPPGRTFAANSAREDLSAQRYMLTEPLAGVDPLPGTGQNGQKVYPDFFVWSHSPEEDKLMVENIQKGYFNPPALSETSSSRPAMIPLIKQWTSLPALSYFLLQAMEIRDKNCRISSASSFKPPPRVTLTDQKREAWLRDLATPSVPLRRLSRTIPHGVRNKNLIEQCCMKRIPIPRAVWFARCVGANELRGLKRKGAAGISEAAWLAEWTEDILAYIEKIVKELDQSNRDKWRPRIEYVVRLFAHLFQEDLLDKSVVLQWTLRYFKSSKLEELPVSLIFIKLYWTRLTEPRPYSKSLAHSLLMHYASISAIASNQDAGGSTAVADLVASISKLMKQLLMTVPDAFVIPKHWSSLGPVLIDAIKPDNSALEDRLQSLRVRNESLIISEAPIVRAQRDHKAVLVRLLDQLQSPTARNTFLTTVRRLRMREADIFECVFEWATCAMHATVDRVYVCVDLCQVWGQEHWDVSTALRNFLVRITDFSLYSVPNLLDLITGLLEKGLMQLDVYFRGLISSGILFIPRLKPVSQGHLNVLKSLPLKKYGPEFQNQQALLIRGLQLDPSLEPQSFEEMKALFAELPVFSAAKEVDGHCETPELELSALTKEVKMELCDWIFDEISTMNIEKLTATDFAVVIKLLLDLRGMETLIKTIERILPHTTSAGLIFLVAYFIRDNTRAISFLTNLNQLVLSLVSHFKGLKYKPRVPQGFVDLVAATVLKESGPEMRAEIEAVLRPPNNASPLDISKLSPVSEPPSGDRIQSSWNGEDLSEIVATIGVPINEGLEGNGLENVLRQTLVKMSGELLQTPEVREKVSTLMLFLHDCDGTIFDRVLTEWLRDGLRTEAGENGDILVNLSAYLVANDFVMLEKVVEIALQVRELNPASSDSMILIIAKLISEPFDARLRPSMLESFLLQFHQNQFEQTSLKIHLKVLQQLVAQSNDLSRSQMEFLVRATATDITAVMQLFLTPLISSSPDLIPRLEALLGETIPAAAGADAATDGTSDGQAVDLGARLFVLASRASVHNIALVQMRARLLVATADTTTAAKMVYDCAVKCKQHNISKSRLGDIIQLLPGAVKGKVLYLVEDVFLSSATFPIVKVDEEQAGQNGASVGPNSWSDDAADFVEYLMEIVDACADSATDNLESSPHLSLTDSADRLIAIANHEHGRDVSSGDAMEIETDPATDEIRSGILVFLKMAIIQCQTFPPEPRFKEHLIKSLHQLATTALIHQLRDIEGSLMDAINAIDGGEMSPADAGAAAGAGAGTSPEAGRPRMLHPHRMLGLKQQTSDSDQLETQSQSYLTDLMIYDRTNNSYRELTIRPFDLLEDSNPTMSLNDVPINLALFDSTLVRHDNV